jgi:protein-tyrosine phosphatase
MIKRILIICIGNICRSPMAEGMMKRELPDLEISSAGLGALVGQSADPNAIALMFEKGIDISAHRARQLENWMVAAADLVLVMDNEQKDHLVMQYPLYRGKIYRLNEIEKYDIADPYRHELEAFREASGLIEGGVHAWVARIKTISNLTGLRTDYQSLDQ